MRTNRILHIRLLVAASFMLVCGGWSGVVWGQTVTPGNISNAATHTVPYTLTNTSNQCTFNVINLLESNFNDLGVSSWAGFNSTLYLRWHIQTKDGTEVETSGWSTNANDTEKFQYSNGFVWYSGHCWNSDLTQGWVRTNSLQIILTKPESSVWTNYQIVCDMSHSLVNMSGREGDGNSKGTITQEPDIQARYIFQITGPSITINTTSTPQEFVKEYEITGDNPQSLSFDVRQYFESEGFTYLSNASTMNDLNNNFYIRWYVRNKINKELISLADWNKTNGDKLFKYPQGFAWSTKEGNSPLSNDNNNVTNITLQKPSSANWNDYEVVCNISTKLDQLNNYSTASGITQEPELELRYIFTFDQANITVSESAPMKTETVPVIIDNTEITSLTFNVKTLLAGGGLAHLGTGATLNSLDNAYYIRWYIKAKNPESTTVNLSEWSLSNNNNVLYKYPQGFAWSTNEKGTKTAPITGTINNNITNITLNKPSGKKWTDYIIVCDMSHALTNLEATNTAGGITKEPDIQLRYEFQQYDPNMTNEGALIANAPTFASTISVGSFNNSMVEFTLNRDTINKYVNETEEEWTNKLYTRWYIEEESNSTKIPISDWTFANKDPRNNAFKYPQGFVYFAKHAKNINDIIINSDFENGTITPWGGWGNNSTRTISAPGEGYNSNYSLKMTNPTNADAWSSQAAYALEENLIVGKTYMYSAMVKSDVANPSFEFIIQDPVTYTGEKIANIETIPNQWVHVEGEFTCTIENINRICINFGKVAGTYYVDDIKFSEKNEKSYNAVTAQITPPANTNWENKRVICLVATDTTGIMRGSNAGSVTKEPNFNMKFEYTFEKMDGMAFHHKYRPGNTATEIIYTEDQVEVYNGKRYQKTAKWMYDVYVMPNEEAKLILPLQDIVDDNGTIRDGNTKTDGSSTEPHAYYRWYDYKTDLKHTKTTRHRGETLKDNKWGYWIHDYKQKYNTWDSPICSDIGVINYKAPNSEEFNDIVACDVSDYHDYSLDDSGFTEPTITIRYIFNIRPASEQANKIKEGFKNWSFLENNGYVTLNCRDNDTEFTLRTEERLPSDYYFYPLNNGVTDVTNLTDASFNGSISRGKTIVWYVRYKGVVQLIKIGDTKKHQRFFTFKRNLLRGIPDNENFEVFAYVVSDDQTGTPSLDAIRQKAAPINYNICKFVADRATMTMDELNTDTYKYRTYDFLNSRYQLAGEINFDNLDDSGENFNYDAPTVKNNMRYYPQDIENSSYGFVYPSLSSYKTYWHQTTWARAKSPVHGEYGYYKSANVDGISRSDQEYTWWYAAVNNYEEEGNHPLFYDRTYYSSSGNKYGYFMYTDASDESRPLASFDVEANLCAGSALIFTGWVANLTGPSSDGSTTEPIKPQVMFKIYGVDEANKTTLLQSMLSEIVPGVAEWRQFYADIILQRYETNIDYKSYRVTIDNYCKGTSGADYAVDDIRMFIKNSQVELVQEKAYCDGDSTELKVEIDYDAISTKLGLKSNETIILKYHMVDEKGVSIALGKDVSGQPIYELLDNLVGDYNSDKSARPTKYETRNSVNYFILQDNLKLELDPNKTYYLLVDHKAVGAENWTVSVIGDACSIVSNPFKVGRVSINVVELDESHDNSVSIKCDETQVTLPTFTAQLTFPDGEGGLYYINDVKFDWYLKGVMPDTLVTALKNLRADYPATGTGGSISGKGTEITDWSSITPSANFREVDKNTLISYKDDMVFNAPALTNIILVPDSNIFSAVPVLNTIQLGEGKEIVLCDELVVLPIVVKSIGGPVLDLGFSDVDYKAMGNGANVVRLGLKQFETMQGGATLVVPIKNFANERKRGSTKLADLIPINGNDFLNLIGTNDPTYKEADFGAFAIAKINNLNTIASGSAYSVTFSFNDSGLKPNFKMHEGYYYTVKFNFMNSVTEGMEGVDPCAGSTTFTFKVVPEYLTFSNEGVNWSNDNNWVRSTQVTLYKSDGQNTDLYKDYTDELVHKGYVPMRFTKVTVTKAATPHLYELPNDATTGMLNMSINDTLKQAPTQYIEYDMMVKSAATSGYDCEKFYSNTCDQIYFKPDAEMIGQHWLKYEKAWVDFELTANKWYMLGSPLKGVVAGDMYLPLSNRRQETEAFQPITYDNTLAIHHRAKLPVYQRSWDQSGSIVLKEDGGTYDAYKGRVANWSHVYNDVKVDYSVQGFSIKADKKDGTNEVMFRLPKADTEYRYFAYDDVSTTPASDGHNTDIARTDPGKLRTHGSANGNINVELATNADSNNKLYLMCNPYMATLDMNAFFATNTHLEAKYWTIAAGKQSISNDITGQIDVKPLQAFLVKQVEGSTNKNISFDPCMTKNTAQITTRGTTRNFSLNIPCLKIMANCENAESTALLIQTDWADNDFADREDVEALFDSNLKDQPTVYTIAGQQTTSINTVADIETIALGIYQNSEELVTITFDGMDSFDSPLYLYDAETGDCNEITRSTTISASASSAGRFFILNESITNSEQDNLLVVTVTDRTIQLAMANGELIEEVMLYDMNGYLLRHDVGINAESITMNAYKNGVMVVRTKTTAGAFIKKLVIK